MPHPFIASLAVAAAASLVFLGAPALAQSPAAEPSPPYLTLQQLRAEYGQAGAKTMMIRGAEVYYKDEGRGPAILMVHGSSSTLRTYDGVAARLKGRYRIIRYDIPPLGLSGPVSDEVAKAAGRPEALPEELLEKLGVKKVTVVGVSSGGTMAYFLAARRPDLVERLILSNTPADPVDTSPMKLSRAMILEQGIAGEASSGRYKRPSFWNAFFDFFTGEPERMSAAKRREYYDINRKVPQPNGRAFTAVVADNAFTRAAAAKVVCPVLLLWGARDPLLPAAAADTLGSYLKNAQVSKIILPDVGHYPPLEIPERYAQIMAAYIEAATPVKPVAPEPADR